MSTTIPTQLNDLIKQERKRSGERIAKLRRAAAAEQRQLDRKVVSLLQKQEPGLHARLEKEAGETLAAKKALRAQRSKKQISSSQDMLDSPASQDGDYSLEEGSQ